MNIGDNFVLVFTSAMSFIFALLSNLINDFIPKMLLLCFIPFYLITANWKFKEMNEK